MNALLQMMLASAVPVFIFLIANELVANRMFAFVAGLAYAAYGPAVCYSAMPITATWIDFLNTAALWAIIRASKTWSPQLFGIAGAAVGASSLFRPNVLLFPVCIIALMVLRSTREQRSSALMSMGAMAAGLALPLAIFAARNYVVTHQFSFTANTGSMNFFIGNNRWATGQYVRMDDIESGNPFTQLEDYRVFASREVGRPLDLKESNRFWRDKTFRDIALNPVRWLQVEVKKLLLLASRYELGSNVSYYYFVERSWTLSFVSVISFPIFAALSLVGIVLIFFSAARADRFTAEVVALYGATYIISSLIFFVLAEYRFALVCPVAILSSCTLLEAKRFFVQQDWRNFFLTAGAVGVIVFAIRAIDVRRGNNIPMEVATSIAAEGNALIKEGRVDEAKDAYRHAIGIAPSAGAAYINLVKVLIAQRKCTEAVPILEEALKSAPSYHLFEQMGECKIKTRDYAGAIQHLEIAYKLRPTELNRRRLDYAIQKAR
ncbi:MAG: hypothetical protein HYX59_00955 [Elusimicrobia bacterium]|nr:hypothetical protein [Elusimicrobiota bacterium]